MVSSLGYAPEPEAVAQARRVIEVYCEAEARKQAALAALG